MSNTNQSQRESDPLVELLQHPEVRERLNKGILNGLSGSTKIDYVIGVVEQTIKARKNRLPESQANSTSDSLLSVYDQLRSDPKYRVYFTC